MSTIAWIGLGHMRHPMSQHMGKAGLPLNQSLKFSTSLSDICWVLTIFELPSASNFNVKRKLASELRDPLPTQTE